MHCIPWSWTSAWLQTPAMVPSAHCDILLVEMCHVVMKVYCSLEVVSANGHIFMLWGQGCHIHSSIPASEVYSQNVIKLLPCVFVHSAMQCIKILLSHTSRSHGAAPSAWSFSQLALICCETFNSFPKLQQDDCVIRKQSGAPFYNSHRVITTISGPLVLRAPLGSAS